GEKLAVVGLNGAGKTTFIKLLLRLYDVTEGRILLNGTDIRSFDRAEYFKMFAPAFQDVTVFAFPMSENVSMSEPFNTDKDRAEKMLRSAGLGEKIDSLEKGVDTELLKVLYDDGVDLSGGEKQKLALARALYKDSKIIVLDEPTAALDALAEYRLYQSFDGMIGKKTAVYISHRLSSTRFCDRVAMFAKGEMVETGTHEELMELDGEYAEMFRVQAQYYVEDKDIIVSEGVIENG
ncbi:MAG: ABC transporter ATP-binding protein/permease, partial [Oscillospiraceae bacterium]|nr:ABC transporter ATP-binding protein/permease [Oscillospiraceae bacterium]